MAYCTPMSTYTFADKVRSRMTEYEVRDIDTHGDAQNVDHYETRIEAMQQAGKMLADGAVAVVVEKHCSYYPAFLFPEASRYKTLATLGNKAALLAGGWVE